MTQKVIYDIIHGNIELSNFESALLKNPIINRLHQILQNSAAYNVYPSMRSSRFEHSIGVMDYAGKMYNYGIINSDISNNFLEYSKKIIIELINKNKDKLFDCLVSHGHSPIVFRNKLKIRYNLDESLNFEEIINDGNFVDDVEKFIGNHFLSRNINRSQTNNLTNNLLFQTIRLYGLFHDIGHLPLSHLFEFSLANIFDKLGKERDTSNDKKFAKTIKGKYYLMLKRIIDEKGDVPDDDIHEKIGKSITKYIFSKSKNDIKDSDIKLLSDEEKAINIFIIFIIERIFEEIQKGKHGKFSSMYSIVSGTIDADRLDFTQRDGITSGIAKHIGNVDRIVKMYCLGKDNSIDDKESFIFMPSIQSINDVEEILHNRFKTYKYIVNHHAVGRSDYIHQKVIEEKLDKELTQQHKKSNVHDFKSDMLLSVIEKVDELISGKNTNNEVKIRLAFTQLTDFWLFSVLNNEYHKSVLNNGNELIDILLKEIYESKKGFKSLWKRKYEYNKFLKLLSKKILLDIEIKELLEDKDISLKDSFSECHNNSNLEEKYKNLLLKLRKDQQLIKSKKVSDKQEEDKKDNDLMQLRKQYIKISKDLNTIEDKYIKLGKEIISTFKVKNKLKGFAKEIEDAFLSDGIRVLVKPLKLKSKTENLFLIDKKNQEDVLEFNRVSSKGYVFQEEIKDSANFFFYFYEDDIIKENKRSYVENLLIEKIIRHFKKQ